MGFQHAYEEGHFTSTAISQMTDDWLKSMDDRKLGGTVLLDFSAAFGVIDHELLLVQLKCYGLNMLYTLFVLRVKNDKAAKSIRMKKQPVIHYKLCENLGFPSSQCRKT